MREVLIHDEHTSNSIKIRLEGITDIEQLLKKISGVLGRQVRELCDASGEPVLNLNDLQHSQKVYAPPSVVESNSNSLALYQLAALGSGTVGKSAITLRYVQRIFYEDYDPTIEDAYRKNVVVNGKACQLEILDTAGEEDYFSMRSAWMRGRHAFALVYSVNDLSSFNAIRTFYDQLRVVYEINCPPVVLVANKSDLSREVTSEMGENLARQIGATAYIETSAKTGTNIDKVFYRLVREIQLAEGRKKTRKRRGIWSRFVCCCSSRVY